jgi:uncharacterized protein (UPF0264 family)
MTLKRQRSELLVSVRSAAEAEQALEGGADVIDVKEPRLGSLGRADHSVMREVIRRVKGRRPVSAALGELLDWKDEATTAPDGLSYVKWGLAGCRTREWAAALSRCTLGAHVVAVAYADWQQAGAPSVDEVCAFACDGGGSQVLLVDTWNKHAGTTLLDWLPVEDVTRLCRHCRSVGVRVALAGSLGIAEIRRLQPAAPDWFAVRGAVCEGGRAGAVRAAKVRELVAVLSESRAEV